MIYPFNKKTKNQNGMAIIETLPLLVIFVAIVGYALGTFGAIHTAILNSIAARTYAFETFRNRTNLNMFRENLSGLTDPMHTSKFQIRYHAIISEGSTAAEFYATERPLSIGREVASVGQTFNEHNSNIFNIKPRNQEVAVNPIWIMVGYGICLNKECGD